MIPSEATLPRVSFIMPAYNSADTLDKAIASIREQTVSNWELIIVDDGSRDETLAMARVAAGDDARIQVIAKDNGGPASARNLAIARARGDWLMFHDSDDWLAPNFLARMLDAAAAEPGCALVACTFLGVDDAGALLRVHHVRDLGEPFPELARTCPFSPIALLVRRTDVQALGGFDESLITCEDWDLWLRLARRGRTFAQTSEALAYYRSRPGSLTRKTQRLLADSRFVIARAHGRDAREADDAPYAAGADPSGMTDALAQSALYIAATGLGLSTDPRACFDGLDLSTWSFDAKVMAGVIVDAMAYGLSVERAALARDWPRTRLHFNALAEALRTATGLERQIDCLSAYLEIETRGGQAFVDGFPSESVSAIRIDLAAPHDNLAPQDHAIVIGALQSGGRAFGAVEWIDVGAGVSEHDVRMGIAETLRLASPKALLGASPFARSPRFWMGLAREAIHAARSRRDRVAAARRAIRTAAAEAVSMTSARTRRTASDETATSAPLAIVRPGGAPAVRAAIAALRERNVRVEPIASWLRAVTVGAASGPVAMLALDLGPLDVDERAACAGLPTTSFLPLDALETSPPDAHVGWRAAGLARLSAKTVLDQTRRARAALGEEAVALMFAADQDQTLRAALRQAGFLGAVSPITGRASIEANPFELLSVVLDARTPPSVAARRLGFTRR